SICLCSVHYVLSFFFLLSSTPPRSALFPYTTLFRSWGLLAAEKAGEETAGGAGGGRVFAGAGAPLAGGDGGLDLVDVLAAASPGGLSAVTALHGTAHVVSFR